jgi:hypothetical protein
VPSAYSFVDIPKDFVIEKKKGAVQNEKPPFYLSDIFPSLLHRMHFAYGAADFPVF